MHRHLFHYRAIFRSAYDADTVRLDIDLGFGIWRDFEAIRLYGIDAPEIRGPERPQGLVSRDWLRGKLKDGDEVILKTHKDRAGKYGRLLGEICIPGEDRTINQQLLDLGLATQYLP